jgi:hypothetical protein
MSELTEESRPETSCKHSGCEAKAIKRGYCESHYRKYGNPKKCTMPGCENTHVAKGLCRKHYGRRYRTGTTERIQREDHKMYYFPEYKTWCAIKDRCYRKNSINYHRYGGRGITVCEKWKNSFISFYTDMGPKPSKKHTIDRIDNDRGYYKENCRWITQAENARNSSATKLAWEDIYFIRGCNLSFSELAKKFSVSENHIRQIRKHKCWKEDTQK